MDDGPEVAMTGGDKNQKDQAWVRQEKVYCCLSHSKGRVLLPGVANADLRRLGEGAKPVRASM